MVDGRKLDNYPHYLLQEVINQGTKNFTERYIAWGDKHGMTLAFLMTDLGKSTYDCFENIFQVRKEDMAEVDPFLEDILDREIAERVAKICGDN